MSILDISDVFTPGSYPTHTYVEREESRLETRLRDALSTKGHLVSLVGPSKSGKTVLVERVVGQNNLVVITGAGIEKSADLWNRFLDAASQPSQWSTERGLTRSSSAEITTEGGASILGLIQSTLGLKGKVEAGRVDKRVTTMSRRGLEELIQVFAQTQRVLLIDDFHYMDRSLQLEATKALKEATRRGLKVVVSAVGHRADDIGRANPEMRGRVELIELDYWSAVDLKRIAELGLTALNASGSREVIDTLVRESAGSPQLMQLICLNACREVGLRQRAKRSIKLELTATRLQEVLKQSASTADYRSVVEVLEAGPRTRGTQRKQFRSTHGWEGDVYSIVLAAIAADPPTLTFSYDDLVERASWVCTEEPPSGQSIRLCCVQLQRLVREKFPAERPFDWDEQKHVLSLADPHFLFYLRWSGKLSSTLPQVRV